MKDSKVERIRQKIVMFKRQFLQDDTGDKPCAAQAGAAFRAYAGGGGGCLNLATSRKAWGSKGTLVVLGLESSVGDSTSAQPDAACCMAGTFILLNYLLLRTKHTKCTSSLSPGSAPSVPKLNI